jgi:hypothetical protein
MLAVPPPLTVPTTVTAALAATGCAANIVAASKNVGITVTSFFI